MLIRIYITIIWLGAFSTVAMILNCAREHAALICGGCQ